MASEQEHKGLNFPLMDIKAATPQASEPQRQHEASLWQQPMVQGLMLVIILLLTFAAYTPTLQYQFVNDDQGQIVNNPAVQSWVYFPEYFAKQVWGGVLPHFAGNYYRPVFLIWLRLNDAVFGLHPWGWHLTTVLLHLLATLLVFFLARRLLHDPFTAGVAAILFGLHPVHIEAVTWISGVTEPLLAVFFLLAFLCYLRGREATEHRSRWKILSLTLFVFAIFEKETGVIFPLVVFAYEWFYPPDDRRDLEWTALLRRGVGALKSTLPYFVLIVPYLAARIYALKGFSHPQTNLSVPTILLTLPSLLIFWVRHAVWPAGLSTFYNTHTITQLAWGTFVLPALALLLLAVLAIAAARRSREVSFALAWMIIPLLPVLDIRVFVKNDFAHDRYLYLPSIGLVILAAMALRRLTAGKQVGGIPVAQAAILAVLTPLMIFGVGREGAYFANEHVFYAHCARMAPENRIAVTDYAADLGQRGRYAQALPLLKGVVKREPDFWFARYNLALTYYHLGQMPAAEESFLRAIRLRPQVADQYLYLGLVELKTGRTREAEDSIRYSLHLDPRNFGSHFALGVILKGQGDLAGARREFEAELANYPRETAAQQQIEALR